MSEGDGSISRWITDLKAGEAEAVRPLWERYFTRMVGLARMKLKATRRADGSSDEEDAALSAFDSFCAGAARGQFPRLTDRDDLWRLLVVITSRKVQTAARKATRLKRGGGLVRAEADYAGEDEADVLARVVGTEPTPESAAIVAEECTRLLDALDDETLRKVAVWRMEGETVDDIAAKLGCARRTVARQLALIRTIWIEDAD